MGTMFGYVYDGDGLPIQSSVDGHPSQAFVYSGQRLLAIQQNVTRGNTTKQVSMLQAEYTEGNIDGLLAWIAYPLLPEAWQLHT